MRRPGQRVSLFLPLILAASAAACSGGTDEGSGPTSNPAGDVGTDGASDEGGTSSDTGALTDSGPGDTATTEDTTPTEDSAAEAGDGGVVPGCGFDSDGDGIVDSVEGKGAGTGGADVDTDGDGTPDYLDLDSDDDGIPDALEWAAGGCDAAPFADGNDVDGDGVPNFQDLDSDGNGLPDKDEVCPPAGVLTALSMPACDPTKPYDFDGDGRPDYLDFDNDHDSAKADKSIGLSDQIELSDASGKYVGLVDSDGDGIPDVYDRDSDNDFILDLEDGVGDPDGDGKQSFRDEDSDGDGVGDACEARGKASPSASDYTLPVLDTDGDGQPDFLDPDSDGDLLADGLEDKNANCVVDATETDRLKADTDGDGVGDLVEVELLGPAGAKDPSSTPAKAGKFAFVVPHSADGSAKPSPPSSTLALSTNLNKGDVGFVVDTSNSMGEEIAQLRTGLNGIITALKTKIPDLGIGVAGHDEFPVTPFGLSTDRAFYVSGPTGFVTTVTADAQSAANALILGNGGDLPENQVQAMYKALTGAALSWTGGSLPADSPPAGTFGALRFRSDALPIVIPITDAAMHNGKRALDKTGSSYSTLQNAYGFTTFDVDQLVTKVTEIGAKIIGVASDDGSRGLTAGDPYPYLAYLADKTGSVVPPYTLGSGTSCKTGVSGATVPADGPTVAGIQQCRLVFSINTNGTGLSTSIVDGVFALLASIKFDVYVEAENDPAETIDVVTSFLTKVEPLPAGGTDPVTGATCTPFPSGAVADRRNTPKALPGAGDIAETITGVAQGRFYCFSVVPKPNTTIASKTTPQTFKARLKVRAEKPGGGTFLLGTDREVLFIVPPVLN